MTNRLLTCGAVGALLFVGVFLVAAATRPGYNAWVRFGSELSLSEQGFVQIANFIVCGELVFIGAIGMSRALPCGHGATWGPRLVGPFGISLVAAGVFVMDPHAGYPVDVVQPASQTLHGGCTGWRA